MTPSDPAPDQPNKDASEKVKRFDLFYFMGCGDSASEMRPCEDGDWISFDDYEALLKERDELKVKLEQACDVIDAYYRLNEQQKKAEREQLYRQ